MENLWHFPCSLPPQAFLSILVIYLLASHPEVILTFLAPHCGVLYTFLTYISLGAEFKCGGHTELKKFYFSKRVKKKKSHLGFLEVWWKQLMEEKRDSRFFLWQMDLTLLMLILTILWIKHHDEGGYFYWLLLDIYLILFWLFMVWNLLTLSEDSMFTNLSSTKSHSVVTAFSLKCNILTCSCSKGKTTHLLKSL